MSRCKKTDMLTKAIKKAGGGSMRAIGGIHKVRSDAEKNRQSSTNVLGGVTKLKKIADAQRRGAENWAKAQAAVDAAKARADAQRARTEAFNAQGEAKIASRQKAERDAKVNKAAEMLEAGLQSSTVENRVGESLSGRSLTGTYDTDFGKEVSRRREVLRNSYPYNVSKTPVNRKTGGKVQTSSDTARKLATEMGGMKKGGAAKIREGVSTRPTTASGRRISDAELRQANRDTGGMSAAQVKAAGQAIARGNRAPYERMPTDEEVARMLGRKNGGPVYKAKGGAGKVRKGMMTPEGDIKKVVKPKKGIGGIM